MKRLTILLLMVCLLVAVVNWPLLVIKGELGVHLTPIFPGERIRYEYVHSVEKVPVYEILTLTRLGIRVTETGFQSYGAGHPLDVVEFRLEDGWFVVSLDRHLDNLIIRVASAVQFFQFRNKIFPLVDFSEIGRPVEVEVTTILRELRM